MIIDDFREILEKYESISESEKYPKNDFADKIRNEFRDNIKSFIEGCVENKQLYHIIGNCGRWSNWANNVNIRIGNYNSCKNFKIGLYLFYFFERDGSGVYLSLAQGFDDPKKLETRILISNKLIEKNNLELPEGFVTDISEGKIHEGAIISKYYKVDELTEEILENDLKKMIEIYEHLIPEYLNILVDLGLNSVIGEINSSGKNTIFANSVPTNDIPKETAVEEVQFKDFQDYLKKKGYLFDKSTILNFLLSLKVKPFVIFTGNSGTGKTKLAQLYADYLNLKNPVSIKTNVTSGLSKNDGSIPWQEFKDILPHAHFEVPVRVDGKFNSVLKGSLNSKIRKLDDEVKNYFKELDDENQKEINLKIDKGSIFDIINLNKSFSGNILLNVNEKSYKTGQWTIDANNINFLPFTSNILKGILIDKFSRDFEIDLKYKLSLDLNNDLETHLKELYDKGIDSIELTPDLSNFKLESTETISKNYSLIPVGANWTDNRNILGFENIITNTYQSTPALDLILKAKYDLNNPYFLILDEMNLSHVERYFSDFLSAIESKEAIELYSLNKLDDGREKTFKVEVDGKEYEVRQKLEIPPNLFIIGTVNVDETTYMFSPKVLDRANGLEFETYPVMDYLEFKSDNDFKYDYKSPLEYSLLNTVLIDGEGYDLKNINYVEFNSILSKGKYKKIWNELSKELAKFQLVLKESGFDFGFRVVNEIIRFVIASLEYIDNDNDDEKWSYAFDTQIKQKILPKLHGSENVIRDTLENLLKLSYYGNEINFDSNNPESLFKELNTLEMPDNIGGAKYPESAKKLDNMIRVLDKQRYVSFIN